VENVDLNVQKLYITNIEEGDGGVYSCGAVINNEERWKNLTLILFSKYKRLEAGAFTIAWGKKWYILYADEVSQEVDSKDNTMRVKGSD